MTSATRRVPDLLHSLQQAPVRFISDERSGCVLVERTDDRRALSSEVVQRFAELSRHTARDLVLLLDDEAQLSGAGPLAQLIRSGPRTLDTVHALCFPAGISRGSLRVVKRRRIAKGFWEMGFSTAGPTLKQQQDSQELELVLLWLQGIKVRPRTTGPTDARIPSTATADRDDDGSGTSPMPESVARRIALRDRLREEVPLVSAEQWGRLSGNTGKNPSAALGKYKAAGRLFAVAHGNQHLYPEFQFSENDARPKPAIAAVLERVPEPARGWPLLSWFNAPNVFLGNRKPLEAIDSDPQAVADAADRFYGRDD